MWYIETRKCNNSTCTLIHDKNICKFQYLYGNCRQGENCNFKHSIGDIYLNGLKNEELNSTNKTQILNK